MLRKIPVLVKIVGLSVVISCLLVAPATAEVAKKKASGAAAMHMHHMHTMMNHGLIMIMQGSNLVMLSEMKMAPGVDDATMAHGRKMVEEGKAMLKEMLGGSHMKALHKQGHAKDPLMTYTHDLGGAILSVASDLESMKMDMSTPAEMKMHHMHMALNHALEMAAEGANLVMMGQMNMAKGTDEHSIKHGREMIADAQKLWKNVMSGPAMTEMHAAGTTPEGSAMMGATHQLAVNQEKVLELLAKMPAMK